ncbi:MAG: hypothetical protein GYA15_07365 [Leptolinea sp.]|jgi:hypothetical protein|nr:hypothetical protein [Leptolinea sp.]
MKRITFINKETLIKIILPLAAMTTAFLFTAYSRTPVEIRSLAATVRYSFVSTSTVILLFFFILLCLPEPWRPLAVFTAGGALFGLALAGLWASGQSEPYVVSGLIPYNDAATYYIDANRLLDGSLLSDGSSRRPLSIGLLGAILGLTGRNLQNATAVLALLEAIACVYMMLEIRRVKGASAAAVTFWIVFLFARRFIGTTMTESLGITLGALALAYLCRGAVRKLHIFLLFGLFLLSLALNVRAGAFFILPVLVLWIGWLYRSPSSFGWKQVILAAAAVVVAFGINTLTFHLIGTPGGQLFGNFSESLYGLASGGERWSYVYEQYGETTGLSDQERYSQIYKMAFDLIKENPAGIIQGSLKQWGLLFSDSWFSVYAYVGGEVTANNRYLHWVLYALCLVALVQSVRKWKNPFYSFLLLSTLGIFISVPFVPPGDAHKMRAYAATIPLLALLPAVGVSELLGFLPWRGLAENLPEEFSISGMTGFTTLLVVFMVAAPYAAMQSAFPPATQKPVCQTDEVPVNLHYSPGTSVRLIRESVLQLDWLPEYHYGRYKVFIHNLPNEEAFTILEKMEPPATLLLGYDISTGKRVWLLARTELMPQEYGDLQICGKFYDSDDPMITRYGFYYPREIKRQP